MLILYCSLHSEKGTKSNLGINAQLIEEDIISNKNIYMIYILWPFDILPGAGGGALS